MKSNFTVLVQLTENIIDKLEKGSIATTTFLNFSEAFDCLEQRIIDQKLRILEIDNKETNWLLATCLIENIWFKYNT